MDNGDDTKGPGPRRPAPAFRAVVRGVEADHLGERVVHVGRAHFMQSESYILSDAVLFFAGRKEVKKDEIITITVSEEAETPSRLPENAGYKLQRIMKLRFEP